MTVGNCRCLERKILPTDGLGLGGGGRGGEDNKSRATLRPVKDAPSFDFTLDFVSGNGI